MWFVLTVLVTTANPPNHGVSESALEQSDRAMDEGYDQALKQSYDIDGVAQLQRIWLEALVSERETPNNSRGRGTFQTAGSVTRR